MTLDNASILTIINIVVSLLMPIMSSLGWYIKHIQKSECCGSKITLRKSDFKRKNNLNMDP